MELTFKPIRLFTPVFFLVFSCLQASENKLFQIVKRLKQVNPSNCHLVSYRSTNDTFKITSGTDLINDLTTGDILIVSAGATANAQNVSHFIATSATSNAGTANLTASNDGATITLTESSLGAYTITGGSSIDSLTGDVDADTLQGGDGADSLVGGNGNDLYLFNTGDVDNGESIVEDPGGGSDTVAILTTTDFSNITVALQIRP